MHIAIIGCGQLSRMLALAGIPLGFRFSFIADSPDQDTRCVDQLGTTVHWNPDQSPEILFNCLGRPDVVTAEKEQIDIALLEALKPYCNVHPNTRSFASMQDRSNEKQLLNQLGIPCAPHVYGVSAAEAIETLAVPFYKN